MPRIRITPTIANEYATRCPEHIAESIQGAGTYELTADEVRAIAEDAEFNSDTKAQDVGPYGVPLPVFNAYRALAKQARAALDT